jgi:adenylate cyclase
MKQVTVLFCDIVDSTALTERLGAEAMRDLVSSFLATSLDEVERYGGTTPQFRGDGFMALFGAPVTQEDHVRRALLAGIAIQRALSGHRDAADIPAMDLPVRIGIHTGPSSLVRSAATCEWIPRRSPTRRTSPPDCRKPPSPEPFC